MDLAGQDFAPADDGVPEPTRRSNATRAPASHERTIGPAAPEHEHDHDHEQHRRSGEKKREDEQDDDENDDEEDDDGTDDDDDGGEKNGDEKTADKKKGGKKKGSDKDDGDDDDKDGKAEKKSRWPIIVVILVVILAIIGGTLYWFLTKDEEDTDDAYTEGNAVAMAPHVSGYVVERHVDDNTFVHANDLLLRIDPRDYINARDQARANLDLARAQLKSAAIDLQIARVRYPAEKLQSQAQVDQARANEINAARDFKRQQDVDRRATTGATIDQATAQYRTTRATREQTEAQLRVANLVQPNIDETSSVIKQRQAQVEQAEAALAQADLNLAYTEIRAPQDGRVTRRNVDVGTYAQAGQQLFYLVSPVTWIVANFKETQLNRMRIGQHVTIHVDAYPHMKLHGHVQSIQQGSGARFTTFPQENATGNYVKIVRRVPVKIVIDDGMDPSLGLPLGLSVEPTVKLK